MQPTVLKMLVTHAVQLSLAMTTQAPFPTKLASGPMTGRPHQLAARILALQSIS